MYRFNWEVTSMLNSMTGYGCAEGQLEQMSFVVEVRSVNSRYLKSRVRLSETLTFLENDVEKVLREALSRGMVDCVVRLKEAPAEALFEIDESVLKRYLEVMGRASGSVEVSCSVDLSGLLALPGVVVPGWADQTRIEALKGTVLSVTEKAVEQLKKMRAAEGAALSAELDKHCQAIKKQLLQIQARSKTVLQEYHEKLKKRVDELLADGELSLDEATVAREVAVYADRADISEETARLESHLTSFADGCAAGGQVGRRLDFITQEMLREANTIGSKASDVEIINRVVDMKCLIDKIKEQIQNIE